MQNNCYVYRHLKPNGEVFYVGIGTGREFRRAKEKSRRSLFWKKVVSKYGYEIQILKQNLSWTEACEIEIALISWYGRKDKGLGTLVNMTDGGEGTVGVLFSEERLYKMSSSVKGKNIGIKCSLSKKVIDTSTKIIYDCAREASEVCGINYQYFSKMLQNKNKNKTCFVYLENYVGEISSPTSVKTNGGISVLDLKNNKIYKSISEAARDNSMNSETLRYMLNGKKQNKTNLIIYKNE